MSTFPQYAKSTDPEIIAAIERNEQHRREFFEQVRELSERYTGSGDNAWANKSAGMLSLLGLKMTAEQVSAAPGRWKVPGKKGERVPYASNPVAGEFDLRCVREPVPGRPAAFWDMEAMRVGSGALFVHDGVAWSSAPFDPTDPADERWTEAKASQFHAALEARSAR